MKHPQFKAREFRRFIEPTKPLRKSPGSLVPLNQSQALLSLALSLQGHFENDPFRSVFFETTIQGSEGDSYSFTPTLFVVKADPGQNEAVKAGNVFKPGPSMPKVDFILDLSPPGFRGWREAAVRYIETCGATEVFFFVPGAPSHLSFRSFRVKDGELAVVSQWSKLWHSSELQVDFAVRDEQPVAYNPRNGERLSSPVDWFHRRFSKK